MTDPLEVLATFLPSQKRTLNRAGVVLENVAYYDASLAQWVAKKPRVDVIPDPRDITYVLVRTPLGNLVKAAATTPGVTAISIVEWRAHRRAEIALGKDPALRAIADASLERSDDTVAQAKRRKSIKRRQATQAAGDAFRGESTPTQPTAKPEQTNLFREAAASATAATLFEVEEYAYDA